MNRDDPILDALVAMERDGLITIDGDLVSFTEKGTRRAVERLKGAGVSIQ